MSLRDRYVHGARAARSVAERSGTLSWADARRERKPRGAVAHARTLLAIHDVDDLVELELPWWTYRAIDVVDAFLCGLHGQARVFEFGSGASTLWLARRSAEIHSVEHHAGFASKVQEMLDADDVAGERVTLHTVPAERSASPQVASRGRGAEGLDFADYVATIDEVGGPFDLITVDGRAREASLLAAIPHLAPFGRILLDDSHRRRYTTVMRDCGMRVERMRGWAPSLPYPRETAILRGE